MAIEQGERGHHPASRPAAGAGAFGRDPRRRVGRQAHRPHVAAAGADRTVDGHVREYIVRASRYGTATAFFLDDEIYVEPAGLWTRGEDAAQFS